MRKLIISNMISVDGYFSGKDRDISWHNVDAKFNDYAKETLNSVDTLIFGRITYELMRDYWSTEKALEDDPEITKEMNNHKKLVFSKTMSVADWGNTEVINANLEESIAKLKAEDGKDMIIFGSGTLVSALTEAGLIDEYRLFVNPVILGSGVPLFILKERKNLKLIESRPFENGNVLLRYTQA